ncbi:MAG: helix-turn-helix transcriptional regulator [Clostridia bacterium]
MDVPSLGARLAALRGDKPRALVALAVGISENALCQYENDLRMPRDEVKLWLCNYYNKSLEQLFFKPNVHVS